MEETSTNKVAEEILAKGKVQEAKGKIKIAQIIFFIIAGINLMTGIGIYLYARGFSKEEPFQEMMRTSLTYVAIFSIIIGLIYLTFGVLLKKYPKQIIIAGIAIIILKIAYGLYRSNFKPEIGLEFILEIIFLLGLLMSLHFYNQYKKLSENLNSKSN
jgi:CBS domain containing-hemolysin-like protein